MCHAQPREIARGYHDSYIRRVPFPVFRISPLTARPSPLAPIPGPRSQASARSISDCDGWLRTIVLLLVLALMLLTGCKGQYSGSETEDDEPQVGTREIDFTVAGIVATPNELLLTDTIQIDATIRNIGDFDADEFVVAALLGTREDCGGVSYLLDVRTMSIEANSSRAFQISTVPARVPALGTYYVCIFVDPANQVEESDESNNLVGGASYPVYMVNCLVDAACDDDNPCTEDSCESMTGCRYVSNSLPCDDELFCTVNDTCSGGACQRGVPRVCSDLDLCDGRSYCDELAGECRNGPAPNACDDGNACNGTETCNPVDGACIAGTPMTCDVLVNNGQAPPTSANVIDHSMYDAESSQSVLLRDLGCPDSVEPDATCGVAGTPTSLEVAVRGDVHDLEVFDTSFLHVTGGAINVLASSPDSTVLISDGVVETFEGFGAVTVSGGSHGLLQLFGQASVTGGTVESLELDSAFISPGGEMRGGVVTTLYSGTESALRGGRVSLLCGRDEPGTIYGTGFDQNDGRFGSIVGATGFVSGTLELGDPLNATFHQEGSWCYHPTEGTIDTAGNFTLLPPPSTFIANGLAGGGADNTLDASDTATQYHDVFVRNAGCPDAWPSAYRDDPCSAPGAATEVDVAPGAIVPGVITVLDQSSVSIRGGQVSALRTGAVATIEVWGSDFTVDAAPVPFGALTELNGVLAGSLLSGDALNATFDREDPKAPGNYGVITLRSAAEAGGAP